MGQVRGDRPGHNPQHLGHQLRVSGKQEAQRKGNCQHPLPYGLGRQYLIHQQGGAFHHAAGPATGAEPSSLTGEGHQLLMVAAFTAHPQEPVLQAPALEIVGELPLNIVGQAATFRFQVAFAQE